MTITAIVPKLSKIRKHINRSCRDPAWASGSLETMCCSKKQAKISGALCSEPCEEAFEDPRWTSYWPRGPQSASLYYGNTTGFWSSPLSREVWYNCTSYRSMQCLNASSESNTWSFYSSIGYAEDPLASPPEVCQSFKDVLSTLRSVGDAHWARVVASALGVCLAGISAPKVR